MCVNHDSLHRIRVVIVPRRVSTMLASAAAGLVGLLTLAGCAGSSSPSGQASAPANPTIAVPPRPGGPAPEQPPQAPVQPPQGAAPAPAAPMPVAQTESVQPRQILGRTTQDIRDAQTEIEKGAQKADTRLTGDNYITIVGNAYVSIIGRAEIAQIKHAVDIFHALNDRYPKDREEFMKEIIKPNGIRLAQLPAYQEYGYDSSTHDLVILEYPAKKAALLK